MRPVLGLLRPNTPEIHLRVGNPGREACWKPAPQFIGVSTIGREAHPIFQGSTGAITLSTHKGERDPRGAVMGQGPCQSLSPSVVNPGSVSGKVRCLALAPEGSLLSCSPENTLLTSAAARGGTSTSCSFASPPLDSPSCRRRSDVYLLFLSFPFKWQIYQCKKKEKDIQKVEFVPGDHQ